MAKNTETQPEIQPEAQEERHPLTQAIPMGDFPEAPASITVNLYHENGSDVRFTVRPGATDKEIQDVIDGLVFGIQYARETYGFSTDRRVLTASTAQTAPAPQPNQPAPPIPMSTPEGVAPGINALFFDAAELRGRWENGKKYWKVCGHPFMQYGVIIWDEVLAEAGFAVDQLDPQQVYNLTGYRAHYMEKTPGSPHKVTRLERIA